MARSKKNSPRSIVLRQNVEVEVTEVALRTFDSVRHLDLERLSRAAHARFEIGTFESGCCRRVAYAVVKRGMVTKLELEPCKKSVRLTPDVKRAVQMAVKKLAANRSGATTLPVPVSVFLAGPLGPYFSGWMCIKICCFGHCLTCCIHIPGLGGSSIWLGCAIDGLPHP
jgi:hypothetical protein